MPKNSLSLPKPFIDYFLEDTEQPKHLTETATIHYLINAIRQSLEYLLNTKVKAWPHLAFYREAASSHLNYGIPDMANVNFGTKEGEQKLCGILENKIKLYEPRLKNINVIALTQDEYYGLLKLRITAELNSTPLCKTVVYDTTLRVQHG